MNDLMPYMNEVTVFFRISLICSGVERDEALAKASENYLLALKKCKEMTQGEVKAEELVQMRCRLYLNLGLVADLNDHVDKVGYYIQFC